MTLRELAKFGSGVAAWEAVVHLSFALSDSLPITLFGITISSALNTVQIIVPAALSLLLAWYGWGRKRQ
jgi:hypothetical protein